MSIWFTSDMHYGHRKVIDYCRRPFASVDEMNAEMIKRYCAVVKPQDVVYILGDIAFCDPGPIVAELPGHKRLIVGNHDQDRLSKLRKCGFEWIADVKEIELEGQYLWLSHYPHRSWPRSSHGSWHLHGHTHGDIRETADIGALDVGVDCWGYAPVSWETIRGVLSVQPRKVSHHAQAD
jgi:calcineurin-like phosphoesterase family protein